MTSAPREREFLDAAAARGLRPAGDGFADRTLREVSSFFSRALFREETARRPGIFQRVDPRARLLGVLLFLASVSFARSLESLMLHAALVVLAVGLSRIRPSEFLVAGFLPALAFSVLMAAPAALNLFRDGSVVLPLWRIGEGRHLGPVALPAVIGVTREGALSAVTFLLRVLSSVSAALWLTLSTRWVDILRALRSLRLPPVFLQVIGMTVRYVHVLLRQSEEVHLGKKSRTVCRRDIGAEQAWAGSRLAHAWERSAHLMDEVHAAMAARGFTGGAKFPPGSCFGRPDWAFLAIVVVFCAGAHLV
ncbi:MAG: cobalt ECF transporter T component CbiQ [Deltaproteobacteria bacterium]|nr:cobalt ECF transporter T component CbiQ [Deltaproteobacteria bacterium]